MSKYVDQFRGLLDADNKPRNVVVIIASADSILNLGLVNDLVLEGFRPLVFNPGSAIDAVRKSLDARDQVSGVIIDTEAVEFNEDDFEKVTNALNEFDALKADPNIINGGQQYPTIALITDESERPVLESYDVEIIANKNEQNYPKRVLYALKDVRDNHQIFDNNGPDAP